MWLSCCEVGELADWKILVESQNVGWPNQVVITLFQTKDSTAPRSPSSPHGPTAKKGTDTLSLFRPSAKESKRRRVRSTIIVQYAESRPKSFNRGTTYSFTTDSSVTRSIAARRESTFLCPPMPTSEIASQMPADRARCDVCFSKLRSGPVSQSTSVTCPCLICQSQQPPATDAF